nr:MAG TPA: cell division protein [Caudoviricetes sp.]
MYPYMKRRIRIDRVIYSITTLATLCAFGILIFTLVTIRDERQRLDYRLHNLESKVVQLEEVVKYQGKEIVELKQPTAVQE